jgi:membrane-associated phospholipid phosphatase
MQRDKSFLSDFSRVVSIVGHPLLTAALFTVFLTSRLFNGPQAVGSTLIIVGLIILPIAWWNYRNTRRGNYTNFDVSIRSQRHSFYRVSIGLFGLATLALWLTGQPVTLLYGMGFALLLVVLSALANLYIKASLHTSVSVFLSLALMTLYPNSGAILLGFSVLVALSRVALKRHTPAEIGAGAIIGLIAGGCLYFFMEGIML